MIVSILNPHPHHPNLIQLYLSDSSATVFNPHLEIPTRNLNQPIQVTNRSLTPYLKFYPKHNLLCSPNFQE